MTSDPQNDGGITRYLDSFISKWITYVGFVVIPLLVANLIPGFEVPLAYVLFTITGFIGTVYHLANFAYWYLAFNDGIPKIVMINWGVGMALYLIVPVCKLL